MNSYPETSNPERTTLAIEALQRSGWLRLQLRGLSMLPSLWPGDEVEIAACSASELKRGNAVLAYRDSRFVLHRVLEISSGGNVVTRGDATPHPDLAFPADAIVGRVTQVRRGGRSLSFSRRLSPFHRALGILFCYSSFARGMALRLHNWRSKSHEPLPLPETQQAASLPSTIVTQ